MQIAISCALLGVLQGIKTGADHAIATARGDLLDVRPKVRGSSPLPMAYLSRIKLIPGVRQVQLLNGFPATYQEPRQPIYVLAIVPDKSWLSEAPEIFNISPASLQALANQRTGALISLELERKYNWKIGELVPLISPTTSRTDGADHWTFKIVGHYSLHELGGSDSDIVVVNNSYFDEARSLNKGTVQHFHVQTDDPRRATVVEDAIDREFANSSNETRTQSFRESAQREMQSIGDLNFAIRAIVSSVLLALLFSTATMMQQSIRERTSDLAVLKTIGFTDQAVFLLVATESLVTWLAGSALGLFVAACAFPFAATLVPGISIPWEVFALGVLIAVFASMATVVLPATQAARLKIVAALARK
jgi:putative ABC transport system permease protein